MTISTISQLIGSLGFPIVCCGYMMFSMNKTLEMLKKTVEDNTLSTEKLNDLVHQILLKSGGGSIE